MATTALIPRLGARAAQAVVRLGDVAADAADAFGASYRARVAEIGELRKASVRETRADKLGITPDWYQRLADEYGEEELVHAYNERLAQAPRGGLIDWRGLLEDPYEPVASFGGWRERPSVVSYGMLEVLARRVAPFTAYLQTRMNQLIDYAEPQRDQHGTGFIVRKRAFDKHDPGVQHRRPWNEDPKAVQIAYWLMQCGKTPRYDEKTGDRRDGLLTFLRKLVRDSLIQDQANIEKQRDRQGNLIAWRVLDAKSVRIASRDVSLVNVFGEPIRYAQIIDGTVAAEFSSRDLAFLVRNPRADLRTFGYGFSECEMMIAVVTALLSGFDHNNRYFCTTGSTLVPTKQGLRRISSLSGHAFETWNGRAWHPARAFPTTWHKVYRTLLWNGLELQTSAEHRFFVLPSDATSVVPVEREQRDLHPGDHLLVAAGGVEAPLDPEALLVGKEYKSARSWGREFVPTPALVEDREFWEMVGFALGDGYWPKVSDSRSGTASDDTETESSLLIFPHHTKDLALFDRFLAVCRRHGIHAEKVTYNKHLTRKTDGVHGYPAIRICHTEFVRWLYDLGFKRSSRGKRVADAIFRSPIWLRGAVLRGWFSADGHTATHCTGYRTPSLHTEDVTFRADAIQLLWSIGVACNNVGEGRDRYGVIIVQDVAAFVERVGYLQDYKNAGIKRAPRSEHRWDKLHPGVARTIAEMIASGPSWLSLPLTDRSLISHARRGEVGLSRPRAIAMLEQAGVPVPDSLRYHHVPIDETDAEPVAAELMYDVEVFDDEHLYLGNLVAVHNSQGTTAKGLLSVAGQVPREQLRAFRRLWMAMTTGTKNAWRTPVLNIPDEKAKVTWIDIQKSNLDMEFSKWLDWLVRTMCGVLGIAPEEIGYQMGNLGQSGGLGGQGNQKEKFDESKDRGRRPLVTWLQRKLNEEIVWHLDPNYEVVLLGQDDKDEEKEVELLTKEVGAFMTVDEARQTRNLGPDPNGLGNLILNPSYVQAYTAKQQQGGPQGGGAGGGGFGGVSGFGGLPPGDAGQGGAGGAEMAKSLTRRALLRRMGDDERGTKVYEIEF